MTHSEFQKHADGSVTHKPTDAEIAAAAAAHRQQGESLKDAIARYSGLTTAGTYVFAKFLPKSAAKKD